MKIVFWGSRGSLPYSLTSSIIRSKVKSALSAAKDITFNSEEEIDEFIDNKLPVYTRGTYGCNTSCVELRGSEENVICDAGSGIRDFANYYMASGKLQGSEKEKTFHIFISHLHWDHKQGFPFFIPAYIPGCKINIYGLHEDLEKAFREQQEPPHFPVRLSEMNSEIKFHTLQPEKDYEVAGYTVCSKLQNHPGDSYGYLFEKDGKKFVYSTDAEHHEDSDSREYPFVKFYNDADLLVFDAQYSLRDAIDTKLNWGHSSNLTAVELAVKSRVKKLVLFHSEHTFNDEQLTKLLEDTRKYLKIHDENSDMEIITAYDGLEIDI